MEILKKRLFSGSNENHVDNILMSRKNQGTLKK